MNLYYYSLEEGINEEIKIGTVLWIGNVGIRVLTIVKVDFYERSIHFYGIHENDLN